MKRSTVVVMVALLVSGVPGVGAETPSAGARVRLTTLEGRLQGTLASADTAALTLALESGGLLRIRRSSVERLEVSAGRKGNAKRGFIVGAGIYAVLGATLDECYSYTPPYESGVKCRAENAVLFGLMGGLTGAVIGKFIKSDRWVRLDHGPQVSLTFPSRGIGAQLNVGW